MMCKEDGFVFTAKRKHQYPAMLFLLVSAQQLKEGLLQG
jgi:hypothetical protein